MTGKDFTTPFASSPLNDALPRVSASLDVSPVAFGALDEDVPGKGLSRVRSTNGARWGSVRCEMTVELFSPS